MELVVVVAIIVTVSGVILANLPAFRSKISLDLIAEEVAITIRQAQVYGIGTREFGERNFPSHGIYFNQATPERFVLFADVCNSAGLAQPDDAYQETFSNGCLASNIPTNTNGEPTELREEFVFHGGVMFKQILGCVGNDCIEIPTGEANIIFRRPDPEATFNPAKENGATTPFNRIVAVIYSPQAVAGGQERHVVVSNTGQIYACNPNPANSTCPN
jgi:hypothetical protein